MDKLIRLTVSAWAVCVVLVAGAAVMEPAEPSGDQLWTKTPVFTAENLQTDCSAMDAGYGSGEVQDALHTACEANNVPYHVALGLIEVESGFDPEAVSAAGCYGLCQLNPQYFPSGLTPAENIWAGMEYLGSLIDQYGDLGAALCAYHDGHDTGHRGYSTAVLEAAERWK